MRRVRVMVLVALFSAVAAYIYSIVAAPSHSAVRRGSTSGAQEPRPRFGHSAGGLTRGPDGELWLTYMDDSRTDKYGQATTVSRIDRLNYQGHVSRGYSTGNNDLGRAITGPDHRLWFTVSHDQIIDRMTLGGRVTSTRIPSTQTDIGDMVAGADGNVWFTERAANQIGRMTPGGRIVEYHLAEGSNPIGITAGPDGNLWFTESNGNKIGRITPRGGLTEYRLPTPDSYPTSITVGADGALWFTEWGTDNVGSPRYKDSKIGRMTPHGHLSEYRISSSIYCSGCDGLNPDDITAGPDGNLWFTSGNVIGRLTLHGRFTEYSLPNNQVQPCCLVTGRDGNLWFIESFGTVAVTEPGGGTDLQEADNKIGRITMQGRVSEFPLS